MENPRRTRRPFFYQAEAVGGQEQFSQVYKPQTNLAAFIRGLVGLDRQAAKGKFAAFLNGQTFTADQIRFVEYIIEHLAANGTIEPALLYDQPFTDLHAHGLDGLFNDADADALVGVIRAVNVVVAGTDNQR